MVWKQGLAAWPSASQRWLEQVSWLQHAFNSLGIFKKIPKLYSKARATSWCFSSFFSWSPFSEWLGAGWGRGEFSKARQGHFVWSCWEITVLTLECPWMGGKGLEQQPFPLGQLELGQNIPSERGRKLSCISGLSAMYKATWWPFNAWIFLCKAQTPVFSHLEGLQGD